MARRLPLAALVLAASTLLASAPAVAAPGCRTPWGSQAESRPLTSAGTVSGVRTGRHACFDRLVLDVRGHLEGYTVRYVSQVRAEGSGDVVPVRGGARLQVTATAGVRAGDSWFRSDGSLLDTSGYRTFRDLRFAGSFEGYTTLGLGVRARLPFRVTLVDGADRSRLVVDVAHTW